jgi:GntR family transcriptional regulator, carbon starvation induced regulator
MISADTLSERAAALVEADIVSGALSPGARLGIAERAAHYGIGATPLREGLSRLLARGLVDAIGQRGFRVKEISREDLADIVRIRTLIECEALRISMAAGRGEWEGDIVAALHRLKLYVRDAGRDFGEGRPEFDALHKGFHTALISACGSPRMLAAHSDLYDQAYRYRRLMMAKFADPEDFLREHQALADLAIGRAGEEACAGLASHIASTLKHVYGGGASGGLL